MNKKSRQTFMYRAQYWVLQCFVIVVLFIGLNLVVDYLRTPKLDSALVNVTYTDINSEETKLGSSTSDTITVVYFWGSWCGICTQVSPSLNKLANDYNVVSVAFKSGTDSQVKAYLQKKNLDFTTVNDPHGSISKAWQVEAVPMIFIIRNNHVVYSMTGYYSEWGLRARLWLINL